MRMIPPGLFRITYDDAMQVGQGGFLNKPQPELIYHNSFVPYPCICVAAITAAIRSN